MNIHPFALVLFAGSATVLPSVISADDGLALPTSQIEATGTIEADVFAADIDELFTQVIRSAPSKANTIELEPSLVHIVTAADIRRSGARDLMDVLALVPGFHAGIDVFGAIGLGYRGIWAHEGKVGLLIDGHSLQDLGYDNLVVADRVPIELIDRIEIFRGPPGAALYGDSAQLSLINIVTRKPADWRAYEVHGAVGTANGHLGHSRLSVLSGSSAVWGRFPVNWSLYANIARSLGSSKTYTDIYGSTIDLADSSTIGDRSLGGELRIGGFKISLLYDDYFIEMQDGYDEVLVNSYRERFLVTSLAAEYQKRFAKDFQITVKANHDRQLPWYNIADTSNETVAVNDDLVIDRSNGGVTLLWDGAEHGLVYGGFDVQRDDAWYGILPAGQTYFDTVASTHENYERYGIYAQSMLAYPKWSISAGLRTQFESSITAVALPRAALAVQQGPWYGKWSLSESIRSPGAKNRYLNPNVSPERVLAVETEQGFQIAPPLKIQATAFFMRIDDAIIYVYDEVSDTETYVNQTGNDVVGAEAETRLDRPHNQTRLGYANYNVVNDNIAAFADPLRSRQALGMARHRLFVVSTTNLRPSVYGTITGHFTSRYSAYDRLDAAGEPTVGRQPVAAWFSVLVRYEDAFTPGLSIGGGIADLFDSQAAIPQPYDGLHAPMPTRGREFFLQVSYRGQ